MRVTTLSTITRFHAKDTKAAQLHAVAILRGGWSFLAISGEQDIAGSGGLFVPAVARGVLSGEPVGTADLLRDEMANVVWAIERRVPGESGLGLDRAEAIHRRHEPYTAPPNETELRYVLQTEAPPNWYPMEIAADNRRQLRLALPSADAEPPTGRLLPDVGGSIHEEEIAREGVRLVLRHVRARGPSGQNHHWTRIERLIGRGEATSGSVFDQAKRTN